MQLYNWCTSTHFNTIKPATGCSFIVTCHSLIGFWYEPASNWFIIVSMKSSLTANDDLYLEPLPSTGIAASAPPQTIRSGIRFSRGVCNLDPSHAQSTVGFMLLWESNAPADLTGGGAQAGMWAMGRGCKYRWSSPLLPVTHLLLCSPAPNRPGTPVLHINPFVHFIPVLHVYY